MVGDTEEKSGIKEESVTTDLTDIKRNKKQHYEQLYTNQLDWTNSEKDINYQN